MKNRFAATPRLVWPVVVVVATAAIGTIPKLASTWFYQRGDTAAQFAPTWYHLGRLTRDGVFPAWMDPSTWAGGNYAAEALFGIYDPLNIPVWLAMSSASDLMTTMFLIKLVFLVILALGTYFLCVEYGAQRWAAAALAVALPFGGFTLFWDAASWASGLIAFAYTPWVWFVLRKVLRGTANPFWGFVLGALAVLQGNPYGVLALIVVGLGAGGGGSPRPRPAGRAQARRSRAVCRGLPPAGLPAPARHQRPDGPLARRADRQQRQAPADLRRSAPAQHAEQRAADPGDRGLDGRAGDVPRLVRAPAPAVAALACAARPHPLARRAARRRRPLPRPDPGALEAVDVPLAAAGQRVPLPRGRRALRRRAQRGSGDHLGATPAARVGGADRAPGVPRLGAEARRPPPCS